METNWRKFVHDMVKTPKVSTGSRIYGAVMLLAIIIGVFPLMFRHYNKVFWWMDLISSLYHRLYPEMVYRRFRIEIQGLACVRGLSVYANGYYRPVVNSACFQHDIAYVQGGSCVASA